MCEMVHTHVAEAHRHMQGAAGVATSMDSRGQLHDREMKELTTDNITLCTVVYSSSLISSERAMLHHAGAAIL